MSTFRLSCHHNGGSSLWLPGPMVLAMMRLMAMGIIGFAAGVTLFVDSLFPGPLRIADGWLAVAFLVLMVTWGAMILAVRRRREDDGSPVSAHSLLTALPLWVKTGLTVLGLLMVFYFLVFLGTSEGSPSQTADGYAVMEHGDLVRTISESEYHRLRSAERRVLLGFVLTGYAVIAAVAFASRTKYRVESD